MNGQMMILIEKTRKQMIDCINQNGRSDQNTLSLSQQLDLLILEYQKSAVKGLKQVGALYRQ